MERSYVGLKHWVPPTLRGTWIEVLTRALVNKHLRRYMMNSFSMAVWGRRSTRLPAKWMDGLDGVFDPILQEER